MSATPAKCQMCGQPLMSADAVCPTCDTALNQSARVDSSNWLNCPQCNAKVPLFEEVYWPEGAPWYRPTSLRRRCPSCKCVLRRKYESRAFHQLSSALLLVVLVSHVLLQPSPWVWGLRFLSLSALASVTAIVQYRAYRDPIKYVPESSR